MDSYNEKILEFPPDWALWRHKTGDFWVLHLLCANGTFISGKGMKSRCLFCNVEVPKKLLHLGRLMGL